MTTEEKKQAIILSLRTLTEETSNEAEQEAAFQCILLILQAISTEATEQLITAAVEARLGEVARRIESHLASKIDASFDRFGFILSSSKTRKRKSQPRNSNCEKGDLLEFYRSVLNKVTAYTEKYGRQFRTYLFDADAYPETASTEKQLRRTLAIIHRWDDEHPDAPAVKSHGEEHEDEGEPSI